MLFEPFWYTYLCRAESICDISRLYLMDENYILSVISFDMDIQHSVQ